MDTPIANDVRAEPTGSPERPHRAGRGEPVDGPSRRFSARRKLDAVHRLMRGEPLELMARELNVTAARFYVWQDRASLGAGLALKDRERDRRDDEISRLKDKDLEGRGFMTELIIEAFARVGHDVTVKFLPWKRALESAKSGKYDGMFTVWYPTRII